MARALYCGFISEKLPMDTPLRARKYEQWASDWSTYMQGKGIEPERFAFLRRRRADKRAGTPAHSPDRAGHQEGRTSLQNLERHPLPQPSRGPAGTQGPYARRACDIQCFNTQHYLQKTRETLAFKEQHSRDGLQWWTYTGGFSHQLTDPYVAWQLRFWLCFDLGLTGAHFWAFGDGNVT